MANFQSFRGGAITQGVAQGLAIREQKKQRKATTAQQEQEMALAATEKFLADLDARRARTEKAVEETAKGLRAGAAMGKGPAELKKIRKFGEASLSSYLTYVAGLSKQAAQSGTPEAALFFGDPADFANRQKQRLDMAIELGRGETGAAKGRQTAGEELARVKGLSAGLNVPATRVAEGLGLVAEDKTAAMRFAAEARINEQTQQQLGTEEGLRKELTGLLEDFNKTADAFSRVKASVTDPSAAGDLSLIFNYMKMLDPNSVVRESEFATAANAGSVPQRVFGLYNRVVSGERLTGPQRADFVNRSNGLMQAAQGEAQKTAGAYESIARNAGVNPENVLAQFRARKLEESGLIPKPAPTLEAIQHLRDNPDLLPRFIEVYGGDAVPEDLRGGT